MQTYHKIQSIFKRDIENTDKSKRKNFLRDQYTRPEFELLKDIQWRLEYKSDGSNGSAQYYSTKLDDGSFKLERTINGRTSKAQIPIHVLAKMEKLFPADCSNVSEVFTDSWQNEGFSAILWGEMVGKKVQSNGHQYLVNEEDEADFILFDIRIGHTWLRRESIEEIAGKLGLRIAPIIGYGTLDDAIQLCKEGFKDPIREVEPEGLVCKPKEELLDRRGHRIITKVKLCDFR